MVDLDALLSEAGLVGYYSRTSAEFRTRDWAARFAALVAEECARAVERAAVDAHCTQSHNEQREANRRAYAATIRAAFPMP